MKQIATYIFGIALTALGLTFILTTLQQSSAPAEVAQPSDLALAPVKVYGTIEPAGREVFVSPPQTRRVTAVYVQPGDTVKEGQRLCDLESDIESKQVKLAQAKIALAQKSLHLSTDDLQRTKKLFATKIDSEYKYTQAVLNRELELKRMKVADSELDIARAQLAQLSLRAPLPGVIYKFDVRLGETLQAGDNDRIILGSTDLWARLSVESYWKDAVPQGAACKVYDSETGDFLGKGTVVSRVPYMGRRGFRTEDMQERFDTKFQDVVVALEPAKESIPIGLSVFADFSGK